ncbi:MAG TPA: potassium channel family protein [Phycisphaerae bacterium]|nr:potassium channel family protein [Phycisphaerae bacterium]
MRQSVQAEPWAARSGPIVNVLSRIGVRRFSAFELLVVLVLWIVSASFFWQIKYGDLIEAVLMTLVMLSAVLAVSNSRGTLVVAILLAAPAFTCKWLSHVRPDVMPPEVHMTCALVFMVFLVGHFLRFILRAPRVTSEVLCTAINAYLLMGILWSLAYILVAELVPGSFSFAVGSAPGRAMRGFDAVYFSFVTLCTVGYGDVVPVSHGAQMLAIAEAATGLFYVTMLIARLVSLYSTARPPESTGERK